MQKLFNGLSVASFLMSGALIAGLALLYPRIPSLTKYWLSEFKLHLTEMVIEMMPSEIERLMPELPTETGLPVPLK